MLKSNVRKSYKRKTRGKNFADFAAFFRLMLVLNELKKQRGCRLNVLLYEGLKDEISLQKYTRMLRRDFRLFLPSCKGISLVPVAFTYPLLRGRFGIYEAKNSSKAALDVLVIPVLGVDANFRRVGRGMGFYDRFYAELKNCPFVIFISPIKTFFKTKLCLDFDLQGDCLINPREIIFRTKEHVRLFTSRSHRAFLRDFRLCAGFKVQSKPLRNTRRKG